MIIALVGVTGIGKSFFKNQIVENLGFKNLVIVTTRNKRNGEVNGIDKEFVTLTQFHEMKQNNEIKCDFEFLGNYYAYKTKDLESSENQVTEVHYSTIYDMKKNTQNLFSIYMIPKDLERAKSEVKKRNLPKEVEQKRIDEIDEHMKNFTNDKKLQKQFDYIFINDYTDKSKEELLNVIKEKLRRTSNEKKSNCW